MSAAKPETVDDEPIVLTPDAYERCERHLREAVAILDLLTTFTDEGDSRATLCLSDGTFNTTLYAVKHLVEAAQNETEHWLHSMQGGPS